jgi:all-trans-retinol 13,14-reductase
MAAMRVHVDKADALPHPRALTPAAHGGPMLSPVADTARRTRAPLPDGEVDVAIVGAGPGGLMTGALLARSGLRVALFDQHYVAGGCMTMFERGRSDARYCFDVGLHYVGDCGPGGELPRLLGAVDVQMQWRAMDPDGFDTLVFPDLTFKVPVGHEAFRARLVETFPDEKRGIDRYLRLLLEVDRIGRKAGDSKPGFGLLKDVLLHGRLLARYQEATIGEFLDTVTSNPALRAVLLGQSGDYGLPPSKVSAMLHAGLVNHYLHGAFYPAGGGQAPADALALQIEAHGGSIHLRRGIERIIVEQGRAVGVRTEASGKEPAVEIRARAVVSNADLKRTLLELLPADTLPREWRSRAEGFEMAGAIFMTFLGVEGDLSDLGMRNANYWCFDSYDMEGFYRDALEDGVVRPRGCYITSASMKDRGTAGHAPAGAMGLEIMTLVPGRPRDWGTTDADAVAGRYRKAPAYREQKARLEAEMIDRAERLLPGVRERLTFAESATPLSHMRYTRATDGTGYGLAATPAQFLRHRPGYRGPFERLYFCGASTRAGHGIVGALKSGEGAARRVAKDFGITLRGGNDR